MNLGTNKILYKILFIDDSTNLGELSENIIENIECVILTNLGYKDRAINYIDFIQNMLTKIELKAYSDNFYKLNELKQNILRVKNSLTAETTIPIVAIDKFEQYKDKDVLSINEVMTIFDIKSRKTIYDNEGINLPYRISEKNKKIYFDKNEIIGYYNRENTRALTA